MKTVSGLLALDFLFNGKILEFGERLYKYDEKDNQVKYSDNNREWKPSSISVNDFLKGNWNVFK